MAVNRFPCREPRFIPMGMLVFGVVFTCVCFFSEALKARRLQDPGMMACFNYPMIVPAALFLCLALASSLWLAAIGSKIPRVLTLIVFLAAPTTPFVA